MRKSVPMILIKKIGFGWFNFEGSVKALNAYADLKAAFGSDGVGISYPEANGEKITVARPGLGEILIEKVNESKYKVTLVRGKLASRIAGWLGTYD